MNKIQQQLETFKQIVIENCKNDTFEYREWFVNDHLMIVERIAMELCNIYPEANRDLVFALVWFHDFGKPLDADNEHKATRTKGVEALRSAGLGNDFIQKVLGSWEEMEKKEKNDLSQMAMEIQIISSADGASHFVGKFHSTYFQDNSGESITSLEKRLREKIIKDWERKIVIPEVRKAFEARYKKALEIVGEYPKKFIA